MQNHKKINMAAPQPCRRRKAAVPNQVRNDGRAFLNTKSVLLGFEGFVTK